MHRAMNWSLVAQHTICSATQFAGDSCHLPAICVGCVYSPHAEGPPTGSPSNGVATSSGVAVVGGAPFSSKKQVSRSSPFQIVSSVLSRSTGGLPWLPKVWSKANFKTNRSWESTEPAAVKMSGTRNRSASRRPESLLSRSTGGLA